MKIKSFIATFTIVLILSACTDLTETIYDKVKSADYGKTQSEIETIVGGAYASLRGVGTASGAICNSYPTSEFVFLSVEAVSDEACIPTRGTDWYDLGRYQEAEYHTYKSDNLLMLSLWTYCFTGINSVNQIIFQVDNSELTEAQKDVVKAELRGLRAYYYYMLLDLFGNVPIVSKFGEAELPANSSRADVYKFVESELKAVVDLLPKEIIYGRFTQNVANTLLARLYLNSEVFIGTPRWKDCIDACDNVSGYTLEPNFYANFLTENQGSKENIFTIPYDQAAGTRGNFFNALFFHYKQKQAISATLNFTDCVNGMCAQPGVYSMYDDADVRKKGWLVGDQISLSTGSTILMDDGNALTYTEDIIDFTHAMQNEGIRSAKYEVKEGQLWEQDHDFVLMRYAEILMMKAECLIRLGSPALAQPLIAQVRKRANLDTPNDVTLDFLNDELLREFCFEGHRRTDNIRFGEYFKAHWITPETPAYRGIFPIPQRELDLNKNLVQNPGY
jgi:starch-binding outer membrane protein, SusD/RagB family